LEINPEPYERPGGLIPRHVTLPPVALTAYTAQACWAGKGNDQEENMARSPRAASGAGAARNSASANDGDHVYRVIEVVGTSPSSISDAINTAIARAHKTLRNLRWFEVIRTSGHIENGKVRHYQVTLSVGFTMEMPD
jgi:hypothetical protein